MGGGALFGGEAEKASRDEQFTRSLAQLEQLADVTSAGGRSDLTKKVNSMKSANIVLVYNGQ